MPISPRRKHRKVSAMLGSWNGDSRQLIFSAVTLARALELGHKPGVVSALSIETSELFTLAGMWALVCLCVSMYQVWMISCRRCTENAGSSSVWQVEQLPAP